MATVAASKSMMSPGDGAEASEMHRRRMRRRIRGPPQRSCGSCSFVRASAAMTIAASDATSAPTAASKLRRRRHRRRRPAALTSRAATPFLLLVALRLAAIRRDDHCSTHRTTPFVPIVVEAGVVTWSNGPEDKFFCGLVWDEPDCAARQNCRSGRDDECEGSDTHGIKCFAETNCDTKFGGAAAWVSGQYDVEMIPTSPPETIDFDTLLEEGLFAPTRAPHTPGTPTHIPTEFPIGPPPDFEDTSDDPSDHWYCGFGIDDASKRCATHCPNTNECPVGEVCYFRTACDARTHAPTPPPTRRPTQSPTTGRPTVSPSPTEVPTFSWPPTHFPTLPGPTSSPSPPPTGKPVSVHIMYAPTICGIDPRIRTRQWQ